MGTSTCVSIRFEMGISDQTKDPAGEEVWPDEINGLESNSPVLAEQFVIRPYLECIGTWKVRRTMGSDSATEPTLIFMRWNDAVVERDKTGSSTYLVQF